MNKNAYLAELTQLLYYMTDWDRDAAVEECRRRFDSCDDPEEIVRVLGSPMKLAVTLHRTYQPTPEPAEGESAPSPLPPMPELEPPAPPPAEETAPAPEAAPEAESPAPPEEPEPEAEEAVPEPDPEPESPEEIPAETAEPEAPAPAQAGQAPARPESREEIFSEIFNAATMAQSAIVMPPDNHPAEPVRKARLGVLIPYTIACVLIGVPVTIVLFAVDILIFGIAAAALVSGVYFLTFLPLPQFVLPGDKLVIIGLSVLFVTAAAAICVLGVWFAKNATLGFPRFLLEFGKQHGYAKEETP